MAFKEETAPPVFFARFETSKGPFQVRCNRTWSPHGVDRFFSLIASGYYNDTRFYRVVPTWVVQFGVSGDPLVAEAFRKLTAEDDSLTPALHNDAGWMSFSSAFDARSGLAVNRTTELFINLEDHRELDALGFTPICQVVSGFKGVVAALYSGYGEMSDACDLHGFRPCDGPNTTSVYGRGNAWLDMPAHFPLLDRLRTVAVVGPPAPPPTWPPTRPPTPGPPTGPPTLPPFGGGGGGGDPEASSSPSPVVVVGTMALLLAFGLCLFAIASPGGGAGERRPWRCWRLWRGWGWGWPGRRAAGPAGSSSRAQLRERFRALSGSGTDHEADHEASSKAGDDGVRRDKARFLAAARGEVGNPLATPRSLEEAQREAGFGATERSAEFAIGDDDDEEAGAGDDESEEESERGTFEFELANKPAFLRA
jgi:peptidyl-prolyl cis-trans isomerase A (cyclophilin A)